MNIERVKNNKLDASKRRKNFLLINDAYNESEMKLEASRCLNCSNPKCKEGCPIKNDIPNFIELAKLGNIDQARDVIINKSILPDICSIVCPHEKQCEKNCIRGIKGEPINIGAIESYIISHSSQIKYSVNKINKKVACIGSGVSSLSFALYLARKGCSVDIYEKENYIGGILRWGIPSFRLNPSLLDNYIKELKELGVEFYLNSPINDLNELKDKYDAIFLGTGAPLDNNMHIEGENLKGVYNASSFLSSINLSLNHFFKECGEHVLVVGGGNAAMDVARCAIRLPQVKSVKIVYRRSENEMPACKEELNNAKEEGIEFLTLTNPVRFIGESSVNKVELATMILGEKDSSGRARPIESSLPHKFIDVDTVVLALGFNNDPTLGTVNSLNIDKYGCIIVDENNKTSLDNVYAGGDNVTGASTVVSAMKQGLNAAKSFLKER